MYRPNESSSSKAVTSVTCTDNNVNIVVNFQKEQRSQRKDVGTMRMSVDELYICSSWGYMDHGYRPG